MFKENRTFGFTYDDMVLISNRIEKRKKESKKRVENILLKYDDLDLIECFFYALSLGYPILIISFKNFKLIKEEHSIYIQDWIYHKFIKNEVKEEHMPIFNFHNGNISLLIDDTGFERKIAIYPSNPKTNVCTYETISLNQIYNGFRINLNPYIPLNLSNLVIAYILGFVE